MIDRLLARRADFIAVAGLAAAYLALEWVSEIHEYKGLPVTAWNPGLGLLFGFMFRNLAQGAAAMFAGIMLAEPLVIDSALEWPTILLIAIIGTVCYSGATVAARRIAAFDPDLGRIGDITVFLIAGFAGALVNTTLMTLALMAQGLLDASDIASASLPLLIGDLIGIGVMTPLILRWPRLVAGLAGASSRIVGLGAPALAVAAGGIIGTVLHQAPAIGESYFYLLFLPVIAVALVYGIDGACMALASVQIALVAVAGAAGYDATVFAVYQSGMIALTATALFVGAIVTERNASARAASDAAQRLKESERQVARADRFHLVSGMTSALSHEISQPLTAARALARTAAMRSAQDGPVDLTRLRDTLSGVVQNIDTAGEILRRMREFLKRGGLEKADADMRDIVDDAITLLRPLLTQRNVAIDAPGFLSPLNLRCDRIQIQQIVMNLIANALDAIASAHIVNGRIEVEASRRDDPPRIEVLVRDNGSGIDPAIVERLFEPLFTSRADGLGLGLAVCANIVEAHGGRIWLERSGPGDTEFRFCLPVQNQFADEGDGRE